MFGVARQVVRQFQSQLTQTRLANRYEERFDGFPPCLEVSQSGGD
jgi:hypothetical protein